MLGAERRSLLNRPRRGVDGERCVARQLQRQVVVVYAARGDHLVIVRTQKCELVAQFVNLKLLLRGHLPAGNEGVVTPCEILVYGPRAGNIVVEVHEAQVLSLRDPPRHIGAPARLVGVGAEHFVEIDILLIGVGGTSEAAVQVGADDKGAQIHVEAVLEQVLGRGVRLHNGGRHKRHDEAP